MRKIAFAAVLAVPLALTGCTLGGPDEDVSTTLTAYLVKGCGFVPTPGTISALVSAWRLDAGAAAAVFEGVAQAVCREVTAKKGGEEWTVTAPDGSKVEVEGKFTQSVGTEDVDAPPPPVDDSKPVAPAPDRDPLRPNDY